MSRAGFTLELAWRIAREEWLAALHDNRLPCYRDWRRPFMSQARAQPLGGLAALFLDESIAPATLGPSPSPLDGPSATPVAWDAVIDADDPEIQTVAPLYRADQPYPAHWLGPPPAARDLLAGLGYRVVFGRAWSLSGKTLVAPRGLDRLDAAAAAVRLACHDQWAARDGAGYVGAEMTFAMIACELRLNAIGLEASPELKAELRAAEPRVLAEDSLHAFMTAAAILRDGLGEAAADPFTQHARPAEPDGPDAVNRLDPAPPEDAMNALFA